jgi:hypothetical protein
MGEAAEQPIFEKETKNENRIIQGWLLEYRQRKEKYDRRRDDVLHSSTQSPDGMPRGSTVSNPTEQKGGRLAELTEEAGEWLELIEDVQARLNWKMQIILRLRREAMYIRGKRRGRPAWVSYVQVHYCEEVASRTNKQLEAVWINSEKTFYDWWQRIIEFTARLACKRNLLP